MPPVQLLGLSRGEHNTCLIYSMLRAVEGGTELRHDRGGRQMLVYIGGSSLCT